MNTVTADGAVREALHTDSDNAVYLRITTEDGFFIYSSPIYVERTGAGPK
ncbi:hypothetical protein [Achromobacter xylosoxidans]|nr:hypothetical protein [Achromobacter xylosoxidans]